MALATTEATADPDLVGSATIVADPAERGACPIENPAIPLIPGDPLREPHPGEPGVGADGSAAPLENPDDSFSADPLVGVA